jgi:hypothetical protein
MWSQVDGILVAPVVSRGSPVTTPVANKPVFSDKDQSITIVDLLDACAGRSVRQRFRA